MSPDVVDAWHVTGHRPRGRNAAMGESDREEEVHRVVVRGGAVQARPRLERFQSSTRFQSLIVEKDNSAFNLNPVCFLSSRHYGEVRKAVVGTCA